MSTESLMLIWLGVYVIFVSAIIPYKVQKNIVKGNERNISEQILFTPLVTYLILFCSEFVFSFLFPNITNGAGFLFYIHAILIAIIMIPIAIIQWTVLVVIRNKRRKKGDLYD